MKRAIDLYCGAGGATRGLQRAGYHVTGVDIKAQPRYCGEEFIQMDIAEISPTYLMAFDFIWASPKCQHHTALKTMHNAKEHEDQIAATRALLKASGRPYVIENVPGAPLINPIALRGTMFGLETIDGAQLLRERLFETSFKINHLPPDFRDPRRPTIGVYGGHLRNRRRRPGSHARGVEDFSIADGHVAMGIDWMTLMELSQAIPPAYSEFLVRAYEAHL